MITPVEGFICPVDGFSSAVKDAGGAGVVLLLELVFLANVRVSVQFGLLVYVPLCVMVCEVPFW